MTKLLTISLLALVGLLALPQTAEAGPSLSVTYRSGHGTCGCPVYTKRIVTSWDHCNRPVYTYYRIPVTHRCGRTCGTRSILRTSSYDPWSVRPTCGTRRVISPPRYQSNWSSHHHSGTFVRIRTSRR